MPNPDFIVFVLSQTQLYMSSINSNDKNQQQHRRNYSDKDQFPNGEMKTV